MKSLRKTMLISGLSAGLLLLSACNTFEGAGKDVKNGGQDLENAANRNK